MPKIKFGDLVYNITEKRAPVPGDEELYIGLEHLDSGSLRVSRWGSKVELKGDKLKMEKGDILFGRRNTYLRRVAIAPHDGLFSAHGMIFRAKTTCMNEDFLPFFLASDYFMDEAIRISVGSLSPTVNWRELKELEFDIPDLEMQQQLVQPLIAANDLKEEYERLLSLTDELVKSQFIEMFGDYVNETIRWDCRKLQDLLELGWITYHLDGNHGGDYPRSDEFVKEGVSYISANCIVDGRIEFTNAKYVTEERAKRFRKGIAQNRDVLFAHNATVGPVAILETQEPIVILGTSLTAYRCNAEKLLPEYLKAYLECDYFVRQYEAEMQQSTRKQVPITTQRKYTVVIPEIGAQKQFAAFVKQNDKSKFSLQECMLRYSTNNSLNQKFRRKNYVH